MFSRLDVVVEIVCPSFIHRYVGLKASVCTWKVTVDPVHAVCAERFCENTGGKQPFKMVIGPVTPGEFGAQLKLYPSGASRTRI
jgi:hypothetical protein